MQTFRNPFLVAKVVTSMCCGMPWHLWGQTFTTLYSFSDGIGGALPHGTLVSGNTFYGTTYQEASSNGAVELGTVFAIGINGTGFSNVHVFSNLDGYGPMAGVISSGNTLYGTAASGGSWGNGTVFAVNTDGSGFRTLHSFDALSLGLEGAHTNSDGTTPQASLILSGNTLYGTASFGGPGEGGTVFAVNTDGSGFTNLHSFALPDDGYRPSSGLVLSSNTLYGTTEYGGAGGLRNGTVFAVSTDGAGFLILHSFAGSEGAYPGSLVLSGKTLYGSTGGDTSGNGTVFAMNTDGSGFRVLHSFTATAISYPYTNSDGARVCPAFS